MPPTPKVHILGLGNLGRLFAHALATSPHPPAITLLFHRPSLLEDWEAAGRQIQITSKDLTTTSTSSNYSVEIIEYNPNPNPPAQHDHPSSASHPNPPLAPNLEPIQNLLITTKAQHTLSALTPLLPRLTHQTTLLFTQNGLGTIDEVTSALFSKPSTRPRYLAAITSHGVYSTGPFRSVHAGLADVRVGPAEEDQTAPLLNALTSSPLLTCTSVSASTLKNLQLEKLTINAILNPLTAILGIKNGDILQHDSVRRVSTLLIEECSRILISLPELQASSSPKERFAPAKLETLVTTVAQKTAANTSSMLQDVQAGRETEIEYINGYFVKRAREMGTSCVVNERIVGMVRDGVRVGVGELEGRI
ncbi:2-dehydropantoate 2-reductase-like protein [Cadophora sp. DSE1049]|nr:2-dehydropantoate 2-reductase-like protein [Cadophora sp. DSE1049]